MFIYVITNIINNKKYIGLTTKTIKERFSQHCRISDSECGFYIHSAMRKYGKENFKIEQIDEANTIEQLKNKEIYYIDLYNTFDNGYNLTKGGDFSSNENMVIVKDSEGNVRRITSDEFSNSKDIYKSVNSGLVTIYKDGDKIRVSSDEYKNIYYELGWRSKNHGLVTVKLKDGNITKIDSANFDPNEHTGINTGRQRYFNIIQGKFENLPPEDVDIDIHYNKDKKQYHIYDNMNTLIYKSNSLGDIPFELGKSQFAYMYRKDKTSSEFVLSEQIMLNLKFKKRDYRLLNYKLIISTYDRDCR